MNMELQSTMVYVVLYVITQTLHSMQAGHIIAEEVLDAHVVVQNVKVTVIAQPQLHLRQVQKLHPRVQKLKLRLIQ